LQATGVLGRSAHASDLGPQVGLHGVEIAGDRRGAGVVTAVTILSRPGGSRRFELAHAHPQAIALSFQRVKSIDLRSVAPRLGLPLVLEAQELSLELCQPRPPRAIRF